MKGKGGHQDGPETKLGSLHGSIVQFKSLFKFKVGKFNDQDGILGSHGNEHDQRYLHEYIVFKARAELPEDGYE